MSMTDTGTSLAEALKAITPTEGETTQAKAEETKTTEAATEADTDDGQTTDEGAEKARKRADGGFQRRINRLTADFRAAEARAAAAEARAREIESKRTQPTTTSDESQPPQLENFRSYEEFETARDLHVARVTEARVKATLREASETERARAAQTEEQTRIRDARKRFDEAADTIADDYEGFDDFIEEMDSGRTSLGQLSAEALENIFEHDDPKIGAALAFYLHNKPDEVKRIAALRPARQPAALARLEASLPKPKSQTTKAPPPPKTVGARGGSDGKDPEKMTNAELAAVLGLTKRVNV